jgi:hypothetical protein
VLSPRASLGPTRAQVRRVFKYRLKPDSRDEDGPFVLRPTKALAWDVNTFGTSPTRFRF